MFCISRFKYRDGAATDDDNDANLKYICDEPCLEKVTDNNWDAYVVHRRPIGGGDEQSQEQQPPPPPEPAVADDSDAGLPPMVPRTPEALAEAKLEREKTFIRECQRCLTVISDLKTSIYWQMFDFCSAECLFIYQQDTLKACAHCQADIEMKPETSKFILRFGNDLNVFCGLECIEAFKAATYVCGFCHEVKALSEATYEPPVEQNVSEEAVAAENRIRFCSKDCFQSFKSTLSKLATKSQGVCHVCNIEKDVEVLFNVYGRRIKLCSNACLSAFKFVNNVLADQCLTCESFYERTNASNFTIYAASKSHSVDDNNHDDLDDEAFVFCTSACRNLYLDKMKHAVACTWCKVKKYEHDLMRLRVGGTTEKEPSSQTVCLCSCACQRLLQLAVADATALADGGCCASCEGAMPSAPSKRVHASMSDGSWRSFCGSKCGAQFRAKLEASNNNADDDDGRVRISIVGALKKGFDRPVRVSELLGGGRRPILQAVAAERMTISVGGSGYHHPDDDDDDVVAYDDPSALLEVHSTMSSTPSMGRASGRGRGGGGGSLRNARQSHLHHPHQVEVRTQIITVGPPPTVVKNCATMCKPRTVSKAINCRPKTASIACQTDDSLERKTLITVPVPIYVPVPMPMYSLPCPVPVPIPIPVPIPVFIPTTRNSAAGIMKEIRKIQDKMPTDPFEAELLLMAEMVADDKKKKEDSDSEDDDSDMDQKPLASYASMAIKAVNNNGQVVSQQQQQHQSQQEYQASGDGPIGDDMLMMALKMAYEEPAVDLESAMTANTITQTPQQHALHHMVDDAHHQQVQHEQIIQHMPHQQHMMLLEQQQQQQMQQQMRVVPVTRGRKRGSTVNRANSQRNQAMVVPQPEPVVQSPPPVTPPAKRGRQRNDNAAQLALADQQAQHQRDMEKAESFLCLKVRIVSY